MSIDPFTTVFGSDRGNSADFRKRNTLPEDVRMAALYSVMEQFEQAGLSADTSPRAVNILHNALLALIDDDEQGQNEEKLSANALANLGKFLSDESYREQVCYQSRKEVAMSFGADGVYSALSQRAFEDMVMPVTRFLFNITSK